MDVFVADVGDGEFNTTVELTSFFGIVIGYELTLTLTFGGHTLSGYATLDKVITYRVSTTLGQDLVGLVGTNGIGVTDNMDLDRRVLKEEVSQIGHRLLGLREDDSLVGSEEEVLDLHFYTLLDMLHIEIEGITHEMDRVVLRHIACRGHMGDIIAFGERRLDEAVIGRLRGIENHGIVSRCETDSRLDGLLGLHIVDIHTEGVDDRRRDTLQGQTEGIEIEDLDRLEDGIRRIIAVLGRRDLIGTRRKTSLEETLAVGILLEHLAGLHIGDFDSNTAQRERAILIIHIDSHTRRRRLRVLLRGFLMARQIEPNGELSAYEERIHFRILCRSGHEGRVGRELNRISSHCHLRRDILCALYLFVTQGIEHAVIRKEGYAQTGSGLDPSVKVHTDLRTGCQVEAEVHIGSRTLYLLIRHQRMLVHVV